MDAPERRIDWSDVQWLRTQWDRPIILKGIQSPEDVRLARRHGVEGVVLSNHGGRRLDGGPSPLQWLPQAAEIAGDDLCVMIDSDFGAAPTSSRRWPWAQAVWLGRATLYGVAASGAKGVADVLSILEDEITRCMTLLGVADVKAWTPPHCSRRQRTWPECPWPDRRRMRGRPSTDHGPSITRTSAEHSRTVSHRRQCQCMRQCMRGAIFES